MIQLTNGETVALFVGFACGWLASWLNRPRKIGVTPEDFGAVRPLACGTPGCTRAPDPRPWADHDVYCLVCKPEPLKCVKG